MRNVLKLIGVTLLLTLTVCGLGLMANAQAPVASAPSIGFSLPDGATLHKANGLVLITATASYAPGLRSLSMSGGWSGACAFYSPGTTSASTRLYFYVSYYPVGDYTIKATATGDDGHQTVQSIVVQLVN